MEQLDHEGVTEALLAMLLWGVLMWLMSAPGCSVSCMGRSSEVGFGQVSMMWQGRQSGTGTASEREAEREKKEEAREGEGETEASGTSDGNSFICDVRRGS